MEAAAYDGHAIGVYKTDGVLVAHIPIGISSLIDYFLKDSSENLDAIVIGKRKREVGLVVLATYIAITKDLRVATILKKAELEKRKTKYSHFEMEFHINQSACKKMPI